MSRRMTAHAEAAFPNECCGFFYGAEEEGKRTTSANTAVDNHKEGDQHRRFETSGLDYMKAEQHAAKEGLTLLGVYHCTPPSRANTTSL